MESGKLETIRKARTKKLINTKLTIASEPSSVNTENFQTNVLPSTYSPQATISMEIRHQGTSDLEMAVRYCQERLQIHPAYRQRSQSVGQNFKQEFNVSHSQRGSVYDQKVLPGYHGSPGFRSGRFLEPEIGHSFDNRPRRHSFIAQEPQVNQYSPSEGNTQTSYNRPRAYAIGTLKRPNINQLNISQTQNHNHNSENQNVNNSLILNCHIEGFQEGYNPNFVDYQNTQNYFARKTLGSSDVQQVPMHVTLENKNNDLGTFQDKTSEMLVADQISSSILDCNIADVIKKELDIDGTLDFI